ncbi:MAG: hypothetical protein ACK59Y_11990 [Betaproteobacteria bacterium]|jgi:(p)ppGpp synthase/HD superfamily hydrolase
MQSKSTLIAMRILDNIDIERDRRLAALSQGTDPHALQLWSRAVSALQDDVEREKLNAAFHFAKGIGYKHPGLSSEIYFAHPLRVSAMAMIVENSLHAEVGILGLLHNVLEVSDIHTNLLKESFGEEIFAQIEALTVDRNLQWDVEYKTAYYENLMGGPRNARVVKIMDKLDNIFLLGLNPDPTIRFKYLLEIEKFLMPMVAQTLPELVDYMTDLLLNHREKYEAGN